MCRFLCGKILEWVSFDGWEILRGVSLVSEEIVWGTAVFIFYLAGSLGGVCVFNVACLYKSVVAG